MIHIGRGIVLLIAALVGVGATAAQAMVKHGAPGQAVTTSAPPAAAPVSAGYVLGPGDTIDVLVAGSPDYKPRVTIEPDGTAVLPLVGRVGAAGQSLTAFRGTVASRLVSGGFFIHPEVSVTLVTATSRFATVLGEVGTPGLVPLDREYHLAELIARAGGIKGVGVDAITLTSADGTSRTFSMHALATAAGAGDPVVRAGDKVFVAPALVFYVSGAVMTPGTFPLDAAGLTVRQALGRAGGVSAIGSAKKVKLIRGNREVKADLNDKVQPGDTLTVGERFF